MSSFLCANNTVAAHFINKFQAQTVKRAQDVKLRCEAFGDQPLNINWIKDKSPFNPREDPRYESIENFTNHGLTAELVIHSTDRRDSALFTCIASNAYGDDDCNIQLIMQGKNNLGALFSGLLLDLTVRFFFQNHPTRRKMSKSSSLTVVLPKSSFKRPSTETRSFCSI